MQVAAAARVGGTGAPGETNDITGRAAPGTASGPPPRLLKAPPKIETLPPHIFSPAERAKIHRLRCFFDSLEIIDEDSVSAAGTGSPTDREPMTVGTWRLRDGMPDDYCSQSVKESSTQPRVNCLVETGCSASNSLDSELLPTVATATTPCGAGNVTEGAAAPVASSWFRWSFLSAGEASTKAADPRSHHAKGKDKTHRQEEVGTELKLYWEEVLWLEDDLILARYLRSYGWDAEEASKQLLRTLLWRRKQKPQHLSPNQVSNCARRGSVYRKGFDIHGRGVIYFKPGRDSCTSSDMFQRYVVYTIERALESLERERGVDQLVFIVDFSEWGIMQIPRTEISRDLVSILTDHYTDVLAAAFIVNAPSYFDPLWRLFSLMVHPDTAKKIIFVSNGKNNETQTQAKMGDHSGARDGNSTNRQSCSGSHTRGEVDCAASNSSNQGPTTSVHSLRELIPHPFLERCVGGESPLDYDHDAYWQAEKEQFLRVSIHRREQRQALQHVVRTRRHRRRQQQQQQRVIAASEDTPELGAPAAAPAVVH